MPTYKLRVCANNREWKAPRKFDGSYKMLHDARRSGSGVATPPFLGGGVPISEKFIVIFAGFCAINHMLELRRRSAAAQWFVLSTIMWWDSFKWSCELFKCDSREVSCDFNLVRENRNFAVIWNKYIYIYSFICGNNKCHSHSIISGSSNGDTLVAYCTARKVINPQQSGSHHYIDTHSSRRTDRFRQLMCTTCMCAKPKKGYTTHQHTRTINSFTYLLACRFCTWSHIAH